MIQPNELRLGNYVKQDHAIVQVTAIGKIFIMCLDGNHHRGQYMLEDISPIEITPEILKNIGFSVNEELTECRIGLPYGDGVDLCLEDAMSDFQLPLDVVIIKGKQGDKDYHFNYLKPIRYLHQLQNLYFALTGQELEIKF